MRASTLSMVGSYGGEFMREGKHVRGSSQKENRMYEHIKESAQKSGKSTKRAKEIAARTVSKRK